MVLASKHTTIGEVCAEIVHRLAIDDDDVSQYFALYPTIDGSSPSSMSLHENDRILDARDGCAKIIFMISLITDKIKRSSNASVQMFMFWQAQHTILTSNVQTPESTVLKLAALLFQDRYGGPSTKNHRPGFLRPSSISQYVPMHVLSRHSPSEWEQLISKAHGDLSPSARQNPCREYLNTAEGLRLYGYSTWKVKQSFMPDVAKQVLLAVGEKGIEIVDTETIASHAVSLQLASSGDFPQRKTGLL